ncbi:hypothetical protein LC085_17325 [Bacillus tianshenii]|uniref:hypothetical protein n=1 Tax=Sutcliffiella tianshenii TaxID=1463404 RepID=UPI001CD74390|nr:hypothetical protein [Bacillus tianshenii]MCA1321670.1 hypothetical protein [Bacillus tianshenii]
MIYHAQTQRGVLIFLLALTLASLALNFDSVNLFSFYLIIIVFILLALGTSYELTIDKEVLSYHIIFLKKRIYKRKIHASQIGQLNFKRFGWIQTGVVISLKKGFPLRIVGFKPHRYLIRLEEFAEENRIPIMKTEGYNILMDRTN